MSCILQGSDQVLMNHPYRKVQGGQVFHGGLGLTEIGRKIILISLKISKSFMKKKLFYKQNGPNNKKGSFKNNTVLFSTGVSGYVYHIIYYTPCVYSSNPQTHAWCQGLQRNPKTKYI